MDKLAVKGHKLQLKLSTVLAEEAVTCEKISGLIVQGFKEETSIHLPATYSQGNIPASQGQIPRQETACNWHHLAQIADLLMAFREYVEVGILIGTNCTRAIKPWEIITSKDDDPYPIRTALEMGIIRIVNRNNHEEDKDEHLCHRILSLEVEPNLKRKKCHFAFTMQVKKILNPLQLRRMLEQDFCEKRNDDKALSSDDRKFLKKPRKGIHRKDDGHYELPLPLRDENIQLPNNKELALNKLKKLKGRLRSNDKYCKECKAFMKEITEKGYAEGFRLKSCLLRIARFGTFHIMGFITQNTRQNQSGI